jgi:hypothetical protein
LPYPHASFEPTRVGRARQPPGTLPVPRPFALWAGTCCEPLRHVHIKLREGSKDLPWLAGCLLCSQL